VEPRNNINETTEPLTSFSTQTNPLYFPQLLRCVANVEKPCLLSFVLAASRIFTTLSLPTDLFWQKCHSSPHRVTLKSSIWKCLPRIATAPNNVWIVRTFRSHFLSFQTCTYSKYYDQAVIWHYIPIFVISLFHGLSPGFHECRCFCLK